MKRAWQLHALAAICTALFVVLQILDPASIREQVESKTYDLRLYIRNLIKKPSPPEDVLIVTVDERSIAEVGRWPWRRDTMGRLVDRISEGNPTVIAIDILFTEREQKHTDAILADAIEMAGNVVLATAFIVAQEGEAMPEKTEVDYLWDHAFMKVISTKEIDWKQWTVKPDGVLAPLEEFAMGASLGNVYTQPDRGGVLRWDILYVFFDEDFYPSLPLQAARIHLGVKQEDMVLIGGSGVKLEDRLISTDLSGRIQINYRGKEGSFTYIPAVDVLEGKISPSVFAGKVVFLGTSAIATYDQKVTPFSANMPGVEKNATVTHSIIHNNFLKRSQGILEIVAILVTALFLTAFLYRLRALQGAALSFSLMALYISLSFYLLAYHDTWINLIYPVLNIFSIAALQSTAKFFFEEKKSRQIRKMFSSYVSPSIVEALITNPELARVGGVRKDITVLFSDIAGFTSLSEKLQPEEVVSLINEYFKAMTDVIFYWEGTFDKIVGDEIMAFWGAPIEQPDHAERAVRCCLHMFSTLEGLQKKWRAEGKPVLNCGIGLNTGEVIVGNIGAEDKKMDYTIIGDHVNIGARVEALTRTFNAKILITESTAERIRPLIEARKFGHVEMIHRGEASVKGKEKALKIYELKEKEDKEQAEG
jgi:adenylate cyclase